MEKVACSGEYARLHILTHVFWYYDKEEAISRTVGAFIRSASQERYRQMAENTTDLRVILTKDSI